MHRYIGGDTASAGCSSRAATAAEVLRVAIELAAYTHDRKLIGPALRVVALH